jgi:protein required for attachment to host cells
MHKRIIGGKNMSILVVVADSSRARIFLAEDRLSDLSEMKDMVHPEARLKQQELVSDEAGAGSGNGGGFHSMGHEKDAHKQQAELFARELCQDLDKIVVDKDVRKIYLVAAPRFLGLMRSGLSKCCADKIVGEHAKDLVNHNINDIRGHLPKVL